MISIRVGPLEPVAQRDERRLPARRAGPVGKEEDGGWEGHRIAEGVVTVSILFY